MPIPPDIVRCYKYVDAHRRQYVDELKQIVSIASISSDSAGRNNISNLIKWISIRLKNMGFRIDLRELGKYTPEGQETRVKIPIVVTASLGKAPLKKRLLYYCHLDVLKVANEKWETDPFTLTEKNGRLYARGTAKMKGPLLCFIHAIECYQALGIDLPINIKIICESMNECNSVGIPQMLQALSTGFLSDIDCLLITDSRWVGRQYPCILHGFRGVCYFNISIEGSEFDLHSGEYGGVVHEPLADLIFMLNSLVDPFGHIRVPGFYEDVTQVTPEEEEIYGKLKIDTEEYREDVGVNNLAHNGNFKATLMNVWRYPSFNLHYIRPLSPCECPIKLTIPKRVLARFSIRIVPHQKPEKISRMVLDYLNMIYKQRNSPNRVNIDVEATSKPWNEDHLHWNYEAAKMATKQVYKEEANIVREGNGFPILLELHKVLPDKNILLLPLVSSDVNIHSENENISLRCYFESTKLLTNYFYHLNICARKQEAARRIRHQSVCTM